MFGYGKLLRNNIEKMTEKEQKGWENWDQSAWRRRLVAVYVLIESFEEQNEKSQSKQNQKSVASLIGCEWWRGGGLVSNQL